MILNQEIFYDTKIGDVLQLSDPSGSPPLVLRVKTIPTSTGRMEISILKALAEAANLKPFTKILVQEVEEDNVIVDFVELAFKNKYLQRGNMLNFRQSLLGRSIHFGQNVIVDSMSAQIQDIRNLNTHIFSGIITKSTKFVFRSRSARIIWLVQISVEMWEYDQNGNLYFEKFLLEFVSPLLDLWKSLGASHMLSVIFFARTFYLETIDSLHHPEVFAQKSFHKVNDIGLDYQDFYKVVLENIAEINKEEHIQQLRKQFWEFPKELGWTLPVPKGSKFHESHSAGHSTGHSACTHGYTHGCTNGCHSNNNTNNSTTTTNDEAMNLDDLDSRPIQERLSGLPTIKERRTTQKRIKNDKKIYSVPSDAVHGNFLPAINTSLNILDKHYMDR